VSEGQYFIQTPTTLPTGRSRYNCTLKASDGRYYWYSQMWMRKLANNTWWEEP
jgi:biofilm PGA synthesis lipoprotein PgaB